MKVLPLKITIHGEKIMTTKKKSRPLSKITTTENKIMSASGVVALMGINIPSNHS